MSEDLVYPFVPPIDPADLARDLMPSSHWSPEWAGFVEACLTPLALASQQVAGVAQQISSPEQATGDVLAAMGSWYGLTRDGLPEHEFRRIVLGAMSATYAAEAWGHYRAHAMWLSLTGASDAEVEVYTLGAGAVSMRARVAWTPTNGFVSRMGDIIASAVPGHMQWEAEVYVDGSLILDGSPGLDAGLLSWYVSGTGGTL